MTCRQSASSSKDMYSKPVSRLNQQIRFESTDEGCPVMEESGTVCGETNSLCIFQEFRQMYDDCLNNLEGSQDGNATLRKLAPFKKLIDDLWEQNTMLVETVEELEQEATCKVTKLQDKLNKSCQKMCEYKEDIKSLVLIIQNFFETGVFNTTGFKFNTFCPATVFGTCKNSYTELYPIEERESETSCDKESGYLKNAPSQTDCSDLGDQTRRKCNVCFNNPTSESLLEVSSKRLPRDCSRNYENKNFSKQYLIEDKHDSNFDSFYLEEMQSFSRKSNQSKEFENIALKEADSQGCVQPININFNIGRNAILNDCDCCCDCSCMLNTSQTGDY